MMDLETFRDGLGRLYRGFDRKPPNEEKVEALYRHLKRFRGSAWNKAVSSLICESTFPSLADIRLECSEWQRREGGGDEETDRRQRELVYLQEQLRSFNSRPNSEDAVFAIPYLQQSIRDHVCNPSGKLPPLSTLSSSDPDDGFQADPRFSTLCAKSITMWMAGADPQEIADWLQSQQHTCTVDLSDQVAAVRGLHMYHRGGVLDVALTATTKSAGPGANEDWFKRNAHKVRAMQPDHATDASYAEVLDDRRALPATTERTFLVPPPAV